jgi:hypothetical protein
MLTDIIGFDDLDLVIDLLGHRDQVQISHKAPPKIINGILGRLQTKAERAETLRQQDLEHKNAILPSATKRDEVEYPHVYKSHEAGSFLSSAGRKYAVPVGSKRTENEVCIQCHGLSIFLTISRYTKKTRFLPPKSEPLEKANDSSTLLRWMNFAKELSEDINL